MYIHVHVRGCGTIYGSTRKSQRLMCACGVSRVTKMN